MLVGFVCTAEKGGECKNGACVGGKCRCNWGYSGRFCQLSGEEWKQPYARHLQVI